MPYWLTWKLAYQSVLFMTPRFLFFVLISCDISLSRIWTAYLSVHIYHISECKDSLYTYCYGLDKLRIVPLGYGTTYPVCSAILPYNVCTQPVCVLSGYISPAILDPFYPFTLWIASKYKIGFSTWLNFAWLTMTRLSYLVITKAANELAKKKPWRAIGLT